MKIGLVLGLFFLVSGGSKNRSKRTCVGVCFPSYLSTHSPCSEYMAAEVELARLHLVIAGAAVVWNIVRRTFEHFDVMHDGLVTWSYHWLILTQTESNGEGSKGKGKSRVVLWVSTAKSCGNAATSTSLKLFICNTLCKSFHILFYNAFLYCLHFSKLYMYQIYFWNGKNKGVRWCGVFLLMYFLRLMRFSYHDNVGLVLQSPAGKQGAIIAACAPSPSETPTLCVKTLC